MTTVAAPGISTTAAALRRLYFVRFAFAAVVDARASRGTGSPALLYANVAVSLLAAAGVAVAGASGIPAVLRVWGAWAVVAGLIQLAVGVTRRRMGGQWPMIVSGGISVLAGAAFIAGASADDPTLTNAIGYAIPGAVFFLISAIRLGRAVRG
jgi:uncharacterized membrane protein HdeD (DUF308 family)